MGSKKDKRGKTKIKKHGGIKSSGRERGEKGMEA